MMTASYALSCAWLLQRPLAPSGIVVGPPVVTAHESGPASLTADVFVIVTCDALGTLTIVKVPLLAPFEAPLIVMSLPMSAAVIPLRPPIVTEPGPKASHVTALRPLFVSGKLTLPSLVVTLDEVGTERIVEVPLFAA